MPIKSYWNCNFTEISFPDSKSCIYKSTRDILKSHLEMKTDLLICVSALLFGFLTDNGNGAELLANGNSKSLFATKSVRTRELCCMMCKQDSRCKEYEWKCITRECKLFKYVWRLESMLEPQPLVFSCFLNLYFFLLLKICFCFL